eukprot:8405445-Lingulodinium_polyedra.AAC.1
MWVPPGPGRSPGRKPCIPGRAGRATAPRAAASVGGSPPTAPAYMAATRRSGVPAGPRWPVTHGASGRR